MIRRITRRLLAFLLTLLVLGAGVFYFGQHSTILSNAATTMMLQNGSLTSQIEDALLENDGLIAQYLGVPTSDVDQLVQNLDLASWEAVDAPQDLSVQNEYAAEYQGSPVSAKVYDDPHYITVNVAGQEVTLHVSDAASQYVQYLQ